MCAGGVVDLEGAGWGVAGYDVVTAVFVPALCNTRAGGALSPAWFSAPQIDACLAMIDDTFSAAGVVHPSAHLDESLLCRAISMCAQVHPRRDVWRARQSMLRAVLREFQAGGDVRKLLRDGRR